MAKYMIPVTQVAALTVAAMCAIMFYGVLAL